MTSAAREAPPGLQIVAPSREEGHLTVLSGASGQATEGTGGTSASLAGTSVRLQIGDQFTVTLTTPLAVSTAWQAIPALAVARDGPLEGWKLIGEASLAQDGTPQISWAQALSPDGKVTMPLHGVAFNPKNGVPGVAGAGSIPMAPQAARTVLAGTLAAVGQYVNAPLAAQQVQVSGITATVTTQVPPFWQFAASQLATGFQPAPVQTGGIVLVSQLPAGLPITVFITAPAQSRAGVADHAVGQPG